MDNYSKTKKRVKCICCGEWGYLGICQKCLEKDKSALKAFNQNTGFLSTIINSMVDDYENKNFDKILEKAIRINSRGFNILACQIAERFKGYIDLRVQVLSVEEVKDEFGINLAGIFADRTIKSHHLFIVSDTLNPTVGNKDFNEIWKETERRCPINNRKHISFTPHINYDKLWKPLSEFHYNQWMLLNGNVFLIPYDNHEKSKCYTLYAEILEEANGMKPKHKKSQHPQIPQVSQTKSPQVQVKPKRTRQSAKSFMDEVLRLPMGTPRPDRNTKEDQSFLRLCIKQGNGMRNGGRYYNRDFTYKVWLLHPDWFDGLYCEFREDEIVPKSSRWLTFEEARDFVRKQKLETVTTYRLWSKRGDRPRNIPSNPRKIYKDKWISWSDFIGNGRAGCKRRRSKWKWLTFEEARDFLRKQNLGSKRNYHKWSKSGDRPRDIPSHPDQVYNDKWISWADFLGYTRYTRGKRSNWLSFEEARDFVRRKGLNSYTEWRYWSANKRPSNIIPSAPEKVYKDKWISWADFLGYETVETETVETETVETETVETVEPVEPMSSAESVEFVESMKVEPVKKQPMTKESLEDAMRDIVREEITKSKNKPKKRFLGSVWRFFSGIGRGTKAGWKEFERIIKD
jgi:hypothetical protein